MGEPLQIVSSDRRLDELFRLFIEAFRAALAEYFDVLPGEHFDAQSVAAGVAAPASPDFATIVAFDTARAEGIVLTGFATSPTAATVRYKVLVGSNVVLETDHQVTPTLFEAYPLNIRVPQGPVQQAVVAGAVGGAPVAAVFARLAGYWVGGGDRGKARRREF